ncbi:MAG: hypothetical protein NTZ16_11945 [Verrucomicrobia bacterium]|nr:hypothetical protein [Verrucomicrobiota bacterium]
MKANKSFTGWQAFLECLKDDIYSKENSIPLQCLCRDGAAELKDDFEITNLVLREIKECKFFGRFTVPFYEVSKTSCDKNSWKVERTAEIDFVFDTTTGDITFIDGELNSYE